MTLLSQADLSQIDLSHFDLVVSVGIFKEELFAFCPAFQKSLTDKDFVCLHPLYQSYEVGAEEGIMAMLVSSLLDSYNLTKQAQLQELDVGYLSSESNFSEEELEAVVCQIQKSQKTLLMVGRDILTHVRFENILSILTCLKPLRQITLASPYLETTLNMAMNEVNAVEDLKDYNGAVAYETLLHTENNYLVGSPLFALASKFNHKKQYRLELEGREKLEIEFLERQDMSGVIGILQLSSKDVAQNSYPFWKIKTKEERI